MLLAFVLRLAMQEPFRKRILAHRLRTEIVATVVANQIVNRMGLVHPFELAEEEGAGLDRIVLQYLHLPQTERRMEAWEALVKRIRQP